MADNKETSEKHTFDIEKAFPKKTKKQNNSARNILIGFPTLLIIIIMFYFLFSSKTAPTGESSPTPQKTEKEKKEEEQQKAKQKTTDERENAISTFITQNYKGWNLEGIQGVNGDCDEDSPEIPCDLHLKKDNQNKVVTVFIKEFTKTDGTTYWFVYEARPLDLSRLKLEKIKEGAGESAIENYKEENENFAEESQDNEPYDPGN
jgi:hypothetical protein